MSTRIVNIGAARLYLGDCLNVIAGLPDNSVDLVLTDPPYFKVKGEAWDNQWDKPAQFLLWLDAVVEQFARVLKPNGSLYLFASPLMSARVECEIAKRFAVLNSITWRKGAAGKSSVGWIQKTEKEALRMWLPETERIIFAELRGEFGSPLGDAIRAARLRAGLRGTDVDVSLGYVRSKDPTRGTELCRRWEEGSSIPSADDYAKALVACGDRREYEDLRREYEDLRREYEDLRRPFNVTARDQWSDVWDFDPVQAYQGKHPCEKPQQLLRHIITASSRPGAVVLDAFMGGGSTGHACLDLSRQFIGIELDDGYFQSACERIEQSQKQERLFA